MTAPDPSVAAAPDVAESEPVEVLAYETLCVRCKYDLRGLTIAGKCPECGLVKAASLPTRARLSVDEWRRVARSLSIVIAANTALLLILPTLLVMSWSWRPELIDAMPWASASLIAGLVLVRSIGYARFSSVLRGLARGQREWDTHPAVSRIVWLRCVLAFLPLAAVAARTLPILAEIQRALGPLLVIAFIAYCAAGFLQFCAMIHALTDIGFRSSSITLGRSVNTYNIVCMIGVAPGMLLFGTGLIATWIAYHLLLARFVAAGLRMKPGVDGY